MAIRILLLDDEPAVCELVQRVLEDAGYGVDTLCDPLTSLGLIQERRHSLIITNSRMNGPRGARLVAGLRRLRPELPILHLDDQSHPATPDFPADVPMLAMPFDPPTLLQAVRAILQR